MSNFSQIVGRIVIAAVLLAFAYTHLKTPEWHHQFYVDTYQFVYDHLGSHNVGGYSLPMPTEIAQHWLLTIKIVGILEGAIAIMVLFGDSVGYISYGFYSFLLVVLANRDTLMKICSIKSVADISDSFIGISIAIGLVLVFWGAPCRECQYQQAHKKNQALKAAQKVN